MYDEKVVKVREKNIKTSTEHKKSTELCTYKVVTPVTGVTNEINVLEGVENNLYTQSTQSIENVEKNIEVTCSVTPVTVVTSEINVLEGVRNNLSTQSRKNIDKNILITCSVTPVTGVTNKSNTSFSDSAINYFCAERTDKKTTHLFYSVHKETYNFYLVQLQAVYNDLFFI